MMLLSLLHLVTTTTPARPSFNDLYKRLKDTKLARDESDPLAGADEKTKGAQGSARPKDSARIFYNLWNVPGTVFCDVGFGTGAMLVRALLTKRYKQAVGIELARFSNPEDETTARRSIDLIRVRKWKLKNASNMHMRFDTSSDKLTSAVIFKEWFGVEVKDTHFFMFWHGWHPASKHNLLAFFAKFRPPVIVIGDIGDRAENKPESILARLKHKYEVIVPEMRNNKDEEEEEEDTTSLKIKLAGGNGTRSVHIFRLLRS